MGLVAYCVAITLETHLLRRAGGDAWSGVLIGLGLGMVNGLLVTVFKVPSIVATLGTLSIFRGIDYLIAGSHQVPLAGLPQGFTDPARDSILGLPIFVAVVIVATVVIVGGHALDAVRPAGLRGRQQPGGGGDPRHPGPRRRVRGVHPVRAPRGRRGRHVGDRVRDDQRDLGERRRARDRRGRRRRRRQHLRRQRDGHRRRDRRLLPRASSPTPSSSSACRSSGSRRSTAS